MKRIIQKFLNSFGWELRKIPPIPPSGMKVGLSWLKNHGIEISSILDVGASNGQWTRECMEVFPNAQYLLYEPHPAHLEQLTDFDRKHSNVSADTRAVGSENGEIMFDISDLFGGGLDPSGRGNDSVMVPQVTMDTSVAEKGLKGPFLIKLDTHGFEKGILEGAEKTLAQASALVVECYNFQIQPEALLFWEFCHFLQERGFRPVQLVDVLNRKVDQSLWQMDLFFVRSDWDGFENIAYQ